MLACDPTCAALEGAWSRKADRGPDRSILPLRGERHDLRPMGRLDGISSTAHVRRIVDAEEPRLPPCPTAGRIQKMEIASSIGITTKYLPRRACCDRVPRFEHRGPSATQTIGVSRVAVRDRRPTKEFLEACEPTSAGGSTTCAPAMTSAFGASLPVFVAPKAPWFDIVVELP